MTNQMLSAALTLLSFGAIEIPTKNETNTLRSKRCTPISRNPIAEDKQDAHNEKCLNTCTIIDIVPEEKNNFSCFHYALQKILGFEFEEEINFPGRLFSIFVEDYFESTNEPFSDLIIYTRDASMEPMITHFAVVIDGWNIVESKWGYSPEIRRHKLFDIPATFGNTAWSYRLKKEYRGPEGKKKAHDEICKMIELQKQILNQQLQPA